MISKQGKMWRVRAYTSIDKNHCFASCLVAADNRKDAKRKAIAREIESDLLLWNAGAGHIMTVSRYI